MNAQELSKGKADSDTYMLMMSWKLLSFSMVSSVIPQRRKKKFHKKIVNVERYLHKHVAYLMKAYDGGFTRA
jgi:hypothetical protein